MQAEFHLHSESATPEGAPGTHRPGGRTARNREAVLDAALATLAEVGYADTCVQDIATRAGVAPSTIYRRWGNRDGIILDLALTLVAEPVAALPDTGDLETDLAALAHAIVEVMQSPRIGLVQSILFAAAVQTPTARQTLNTIITRRVEDTKGIAERAVARGELPADTDPARVINTLAAPIYHRWFITGETPDTDDLTRFAKVATLAARHGLLS
ncbi:TetR/AcrR family transcriptional regulator [Streptacidiphilus jiangxiensis]|uniref:DNA-binding transcriptional regulator, AcrR family n=1 Tax=Streptacidiphilus jiangxiensis TaxID=235985 RepID=A0A1H7HFX7_STRJI|nr:TetR/AcrR family transcriptional regulator [Streptacidiphilus jiangxiensis]SEK49209.1 DNA-binding transcriptional regulator, AcrR family [Streptacidiphilus jiangxiensis]